MITIPNKENLTEEMLSKYELVMKYNKELYEYFSTLVMNHDHKKK